MAGHRLADRPCDGQKVVSRGVVYVLGRDGVGDLGVGGHRATVSETGSKVEALIEAELTSVIGRRPARTQRRAHRAAHGHRPRILTSTVGDL
ncbi:hypothetical protein GCM10023215_46740 [Pseudonocardia yuanmonensis]|uniref:Uncharacterized protein n=1 Tax=Pseudonocardia yuanmonensis TaxID=1095914 RepID=A0ABP8X7R8_9PSEU